MKTFSPSEAAFEGFRVIRNHPGAVLVWAVAYLLFYLVIGLVAVTAFAPQLAMLSDYTATKTMAADTAMSFVGSFMLALLILVPLGIFVHAIFLNAVYRPVLRPLDRGFFFLKVSGDEWRVFLTTLALVGLAILAEIALLIVTTIVVAVMAIAMGGAIAASGAHPTGAAGGIGALIGLVTGLAIFCLVIWVAIRMSMALPMTFAQKRVRVFGSWGVTKGRFWSLFGCYLLAVIFAALIGILGWIVSVCAGAVITGDWSGLSMTNPRTMMMSRGLGLMTHMFTAGAMVQIILSNLIGAISRVVLYAPFAAAYRALGEGPADGEAEAQGLVT